MIRIFKKDGNRLKEAEGKGRRDDARGFFF